MGAGWRYGEEAACRTQARGSGTRNCSPPPCPYSSPAKGENPSRREFQETTSGGCGSIAITHCIQSRQRGTAPFLRTRVPAFGGHGVGNAATARRRLQSMDARRNTLEKYRGRIPRTVLSDRPRAALAAARPGSRTEFVGCLTAVAQNKKRAGGSRPPPAFPATLRGHPDRVPHGPRLHHLPPVTTPTGMANTQPKELPTYTVSPSTSGWL